MSCLIPKGKYVVTGKGDFRRLTVQERHFLFYPRVPCRRWQDCRGLAWWTGHGIRWAMSTQPSCRTCWGIRISVDDMICFTVNIMETQPFANRFSAPVFLACFLGGLNHCEAWQPGSPKPTLKRSIRAWWPDGNEASSEKKLRES